MGTNNISLVGTAPVLAVGDHYDQYFNAIVVDFVPRNSSGVVTSLAGSIGSSTYLWNKAYVRNFEGTNGSEIAFNNDGLDIDFRFEWDSGDALFIEGSSGNIGINTNTPTSPSGASRFLEISGDSVSLVLDDSPYIPLIVLLI